MRQPPVYLFRDSGDSIEISAKRLVNAHVALVAPTLAYIEHGMECAGVEIEQRREPGKDISLALGRLLTQRHQRVTKQGLNR